MTNTQLLYSQHVENVRHNRATEAAKEADIQNTQRQLDIQQEYNQAQVEINRLKLAQDKAIAEVKAELEKRNLDQQQLNNLNNWLVNAKRLSADIARSEVQNQKDLASIDVANAKAVQETPLGYLAVKGSTKLFESLPGAREVIDTLWPSMATKNSAGYVADNNPYDTAESSYIVQDYSNETKLQITDKVSKLIDGTLFAKDSDHPYTAEEVWRRAAPKSEVATWDSWSKEMQADIYNTHHEPWLTQYWRNQYDRYRKNWALREDNRNSYFAEQPVRLPR